jgi:acyl transferase domain-containing protein
MLMGVTHTYRTRIHAAHPMLKNHRVFGTPVLPGLAYIDLLYQLASASLRVDVTSYALRRLAIHAPLAIEDGDVAELMVAFARTDGGWRIEVRRTGSSDTLLVNAELQSNSPPPDAQLDLDDFKASSTQRINLQRIYDAASKRGLNHSGPMLPEGEIFMRGLDRLVRLRVREKVDAQHLIWHPALIDGAAMATESLRDESDVTLYLPLFYDRFSARAPFDDECYALIRGSQVRGVHEITTLDIDFFDAHGRQVAALHGITSKRVRAPEHITRAAVPLKGSRLPPNAAIPEPVGDADADAAAVGDTLRAIVAARLGMPAGSVEPSAGFFSLGLQSSQLLGVVADIEKAFAISLSPTLLFEHANLNEVRGHLLGVLARRPTSRLPTHASALPPARDYMFTAADRLLSDHRVYGRPALMGIVHPCLAFHGVAHARDIVACELRRIVFHGGPISLEATESLRLHVEWSRGEQGIVFQVLRQPQGELCCEGRLVPETPPADKADLAELWGVASALSEEQLERLYAGVSAFELGTSIRTIERAARLGDGSLIIRVKLADEYSTASADTTYPLDPRMLAACYFLYDEQAAKLGEGAVPVPLAIESLVLHRRVPPTASIVTTVHTLREDLQVFDATVYDEDGSVVAQVRNASLRLVRNRQRLVGRWSKQNNEPQASSAGIAVAVIGLSGRYPQATDLDVFWQNLVNGRDCISEIPRARWDWRAYYSAEGRAPGKITSKWGGFIDDVDRFAPLFFSIAPREAACMDPQERLFLEESWNALEDAGYTRAALGAGTVGVYVGVMSQEYPLYALEPHAGAGGLGIASGIGTIANRVSYCFDLRGPSMAVDTMCSSSLTAIALACEALHARSIDAALAGGVNVSIHPNKYLMLAQGGFLSTAGRCGSFGDGAAGYVPGEGVGVAVLKRLDDALRDGDQVYGVIRGIATNHGGRASGYAVPNPRAQFEVIRRAWKQAGLRPEQLSYVEAHGTGTALGDPIEIEGLTRAVREYTSAHGFCAIGSVKSNIGHLESAAGIAALTKVLLQMRHGMLVPSLHCEVLNPNIDFERSPFVVQREAAPWPRRRDMSADNQEIARIAAVSSFGAGGSNAHLVVEELIVRPEATAPQEAVLIVLSARTAEELQERARSLLEVLRRGESGGSDLTRIAWTLQVGREAMDERLALIVESRDQLQALLAGWLQGVTTGVARGRVAESAAISLFTQDDDLAPAVEAWLLARKLGKLAQLWVHGGVIDWARLYAPHPPRRISLPGYPFTRQRCWIGDPGVGTTQPKRETRALTPEECTCEPARKAEAPQFDPIVFSERWIPGGAAEATWSPSTCLLFAQDRKQLLALHAAVRGRWPAATVHIALAAPETGTENDPSSSLVAHSDAAGIDPPLAALRDRGERIDIVIYWSESADRPAYSALRITLRSLIHSGLPLRRFVLAGRAVANTVDAWHLEAYEALLRSVRPLLGGAEIGTVFLQAESSLVPQLDDEEWLARLTTEASVPRLQAVRWRGDERLLREFAAQALPAFHSSPFKAGGTYLITGGLGALGHAVARHLASVLHVHLVLVGRSPLESERAARLEALRAFGVRVCYLCCDVADVAALHDALAQNGVAGSIRGVVHAAGISELSTLADCDDSRFEAVLAPKIAGTLALDEALADEPLDFICYFSSVAAVLGDFGLGAYAAGNRFQVALARQPAKDGVRRIAIQWPLWREGGMALGNAEGQVLYLASSGQHALSTGKAMELLPRLLASDDPAPVVLCGDPARMRAMLEHEYAVRATPATHSPIPAPVLPPGELPAGLSLRARIEHDLKGLVSQLLHIELANVGRGVNFADFGFDSMSLQDFARQLGEHYGVEIVPAVLFDHPNIERLAGHLLATYRGALTDAVSVQALAARAESAAAAAPVRPVVSKVTEQRSIDAQPVPTQSAEPVSSDTRESPNGRDADSRRPGRDEPVPIAIIGMSGRFPKARDVEEMWRTLRQGHDAIEEIPPERFDVAAVFQPGAVVPDKTNCKWSGILPGADEFDPLFFEISPREAAQIDPRQRLVLQEAYRALEDAGIGPQQLARGPVGVFVGAESGAYQDVAGEKVSITANHEAVLAARLSHFLDLSGPNMVINTACSSGLVALHQACVSLSVRECDSAVVAAVNLLLAPESFIGMSQAGILSPDGRCYSFDRRANGIVPGEAVVALVVKRLPDALADRDPIYALVRGSGVNQDGRTNGLTAPSGRAQRNLLRQVYERCGVDCGQIESLIAHGTATRLGDHIELRALTEAFAAGGQRRGRCALTSTKSTFGHTFAASGLLSVVAMVQSMRHGLIPRSLHCENESEDARGLGSFFFVNQSNLPWPRTPGRPRFGAVSAFGMSGTNAHVVLESWDDEPARSVRACYPLALSGRSDAALRRRAADLAEWLHGQPAEAVSLGMIADTLLHGRHHHRHRSMLIVDDREAALAALERFARVGEVENAFSGVVNRDFTPEVAAQARADELAKLAAHLDDATRLKAALRELAQHYCAGVTPRLPEGRDGSAVQRAHLPAYSFERERYWIARREVRGATPPPADPIAEVVDSLVAHSAGTPLVEQVIQRVLDHLGVSPAQVGPDDPLDELGLDSISAALLLTKLRELVPQTAESLFLEYPTLAGLRRYFASLESDARTGAPRPDARQLQPSEQSEAAEPASIIGLAGLFPEARNLAELWSLLTERRVVTGPLPASRRELVGLPADAPLCHGAFLEYVECFDRERFRMSREEACAADPQLRKLIEVVWQAVANSAYTLKDFRTRTTGVFVATAGHSGYREIPAFTARGEPLASGESPALYANRLSNLFDLKGPSTVVDAGCAGFLVALEAAMAALRSGRCEQAIVATAKLYLSPHELSDAEPGPLYSKGTQTRSFAHDSDGYLRSEAVGALVLKLRHRAVRDGDAIYANVLGAGAWHGGKSPLKWYSPNVQGQRMAIRQAFEQARILPQTVGYIEAEANGSQLGDASEIMAIQGEYATSAPDCARSQASGPIFIGSLKPLLGHAEAAATFHALTKVVLSLQHRRLPGTPDPGQINPGIHLEPGFALLLETRDWHRAAYPRRAAVHSLSVGGVNAHVLLEEAAPPARSADEPSVHIFVFSAPAPELLRETVGKMLAVLEGEGVALSARDVAATLQLARDAESCRLAVIAPDLTTLCAHLRHWWLGSGTAGELLEAGASEPQKVLARSWVEGARINWHSELGFKPWRRVHLPPPELRREVCWHGGLGEQRLPSCEIAGDAFGPVLLRPRWVAQPLRMDEPSDGTILARRMTVFCDWPAYRFESFRRQATERDGLRTVACKAAALLPDRFGVYSRALFGLVKELLAELHEERALVQVVLPSGLDQLGLHGLVGLLRTAAREHSRFCGQLIVLDRDMDAAEAICALRTVAREPRADYVQLCDRTRWIQTWDLVRPDELSAWERAVPEPGGESPVLLVTGGSGGIGMDLAEHILQSHPRVQVVLAGRSPHSPRAQRIAQLQEQTDRLHYLSADLGCQRDVHSLIERTLKCCARLTGIVHCAGVTHDGTIARKSTGEIDAVLLPKVSGLFHLDEATKDLPLQFLVAFSSLSSLCGNPGQADYCMANAFMDTFAAYRNQLVCFGERSGRTLSINWPLWRHGGMKMSEEVQRRLAQEHGMLPMPSPVGFDLLLALLNGSGPPQVAVKYGHVARLIDDYVNQGGNQGGI